MKLTIEEYSKIIGIFNLLCDLKVVKNYTINFHRDYSQKHFPTTHIEITL